MKRFLIVMVCAVCFWNVVPYMNSNCQTSIIEVQAAKKVSKTEKKIKVAAKCYARGHILEQYRYESSFEILEEFRIKVTKKNVKLMNKWVKHYEKVYLKKLKSQNKNRG